MKYIKYLNGFWVSNNKKFLIRELFSEIKIKGIRDGMINFFQARNEKLNLEDQNNKKMLIQKINIDEKKINDYYSYEDHPEIETLIKYIAFYLPQFHPFKENDEFWGRGFTEWTNVTKASSNFDGHNQPRLPIHLGFYDLRILENMREQAKLAKNYGLYGFCFYYYWFSGKKVMTTPLENLYNNQDLDMNYSICWANENWSRRWDGKDNDILLEQKYELEDPKQLISDLAKYFLDSRYIKIKEKPIFIVYNIHQIPEFELVLKIWREQVKLLNNQDLFVIGVKSFLFKNHENYDIDALVEFPPHQVSLPSVVSSLNMCNKNYVGDVFDYSDLVNSKIKMDEPEFSREFRGCTLEWDNTARKQDSSYTFINCTPLKFKQWLSYNSHYTLKNNKLAPEEKIVFINAWNEWAEGTYLEPDRKNGFAHLNALHCVNKIFDINFVKYYSGSNFIKKNTKALIFHLHYFACFDFMVEKLNQINERLDIFITLSEDVASIEHIRYIEKLLPDANILITENRGRDVFPFIQMFSIIKNFNYQYICKIHSKQTLYRDDGKLLYIKLLDSLLSNNIIDNLINLDTGLLIPKNFAMKLNDVVNGYDSLIANKDNVIHLCKILGITFEQDAFFPAGTMFWFKPNALDGIQLITSKYFLIEEGYVDGTIPHAVERIIGLLAIKNQYTIKFI